MIKGVLKEIVFTSVNGGRPNTDGSVQREDIEALIPAAVNFALTGDYWGNMNAEGDKEVPSGIVTEIELTPIKKDNRGIEYVDMTIPVVNVGGHGGIRYVQDNCGNNYFPRSTSVSKSRWDCILDGYREYTPIKDKIKVFGRDPLTKTLFVGIIADSSLLSDEDELPIPAGSEPQVIDMLVGFFTNQRMQAKEYVINGVDPLNEVR